MAPDEDGPAPPAVQDEDVALPEGAEPSPEERRLAGSPHAVAANAALLAFTRSARSFTLYDPSNKVVRTLIGDYRDKLQKALASFGSLVLEVHPFELVLGREVVYLEKDRERSLSFRLFRDGVRRIGFEPGMTWEEMLRLLQILSIRYTGVRQQEDDLVTLLRKAAFDHVRIAAIEGFVPEEEFAEPPIGDLLRGATERYDAPAQWDLPLPPFPEAVPLRHRPVGAELLERLRSEEAEEAVPREAVRAVAELLHAPGRPDLEAVLGFALEVREFLLVEQRVDQVAELGRMVRQALQSTPEAAAAFLGSFLDTRTLGALVRTLPADREELPAPFLELLDAAPGGDARAARGPPGRGGRTGHGRPSCAAWSSAASSTRRRRSSSACASRAERRRWCCCASSRTWMRRPRSTGRSRPRRRRTPRCSTRRSGSWPAPRSTPRRRARSTTSWSRGSSRCAWRPSP